MSTDTRIPTKRIRFTMEADGFALGHEADMDYGVADAYVNHRRVAEFVDGDDRRDKMIRSGKLRTK